MDSMEISEFAVDSEDYTHGEVARDKMRAAWDKRKDDAEWGQLIKAWLRSLPPEKVRELIQGELDS